MGAAECIEWSGEYPALLWSLHPCGTADDEVEPANDNAHRLTLIVRHNVPQSEEFFPHARAGVLCDGEYRLIEICAPSTRQGEAQLAQAHRAEQAGGWGLTNYRFTGKEEDVEVGLQYFGFRYLNPLIGRWISPDPLEVHSVGASGEFNVYAYVSGAVLKNTDPLGLADGAEGQSGAGADDGSKADSGADPDAKTQESGPQQQAAAQAEAERNKDSYLAGAEAGAKASDAQAKDKWSRFEPDAREKLEAARLTALAACGAACKGYEKEFNEGYGSGFSNRESERFAEGFCKSAVLSGVAGAGSPQNSMGSGGTKLPPRTTTQPAPGKIDVKPGGKATSGAPRGPGPTIDPTTGQPVGRFVVDPKGNAMIEPVGGKTVSAGKGGVDTHTTYPNGSNYQRLNPQGHGNNVTPHGHGHAPGTGPAMKGQGPSLAPDGRQVPFNSPDAHWPIK